MFLAAYPSVRGESNSITFRQVTPEVFAKQAKKYMPYQEDICYVIERQFDEWRALYAEELAKERAKQLANEQKRLEDAKNVSWLEAMLRDREK